MEQCPSLACQSRGLRSLGSRGPPRLHSVRNTSRAQRRRTGPFRVRAAYGEEPTSDPQDYLALGLATCFAKTDGGKLEEKELIEPLSASSVECLANGSETSFKAVTALTLQEALGLDRSVLPQEFASGSFCENYVKRCGAAARTWTRSHAQDNLMDIVPIGQVKNSFNYKLTSKRVIDAENIVTDDDNIRQDMSIDVYGRKKDEEYAEKVKQEEEEAPKASSEEDEEEGEDEEDEDLDSLLLG